MDNYTRWVNSPAGRILAKKAGLPTPAILRRFDGKPMIVGSVLVGAHKARTHLASVLAFLHAQDAEVVGVGIESVRDLADDNSHFGAVVFDATGMALDDIDALYDFFTPIARRLRTNAKVLIIAHEKSPQDSVVVGALTGFVKSFAKEVGRGVAVNLWVAKDDSPIDVHLDFWLSPRCAYVSGQVVVSGQKAVLQQTTPNTPLLDKTILVTGASGGIGQAVCQVLHRMGAKVVAVDVHGALASLQKVALNTGARVLPLDISDKNAAQKIIDEVGALDGIVHNAGITRDKTLANMKPQAWQSVLDVNLRAPIAISEYLLANQGFNTGASIVCVSSIAGIAGNRGQTNYAASKAGLASFVKAYAPHLSHGITLNAVAPGFIETKMTQKLPLVIKESARRMNAMAQGGEPIDVAEAIAYLLCAKDVNGALLRVCGLSILGA